MELRVEIGKKYPQITGPIADAFAMEMNSIVTTADFTKLTLDFTGTQILSSMAMGTLVSVYQRLTEQGKTMQIVSASPKVVRLLQMIKMDHLLEDDSEQKSTGTA